MMRQGLAALLSHWTRAPGRLLVLIVGLALATGLWSGVQAINAEARSSYTRAADRAALSALGRIERPGGTLTWADFVRLRRGGWLVSPVVEGDTEINGQQLRLIGIDPLTAPRHLWPADTPLSDQTATGSLIFATPSLAARIDATPAADLPEGQAIADISLAAQHLGTGQTLSRLILTPGQPMHQRPLAEIDPTLSLIPPTEFTDLSRLTESFHLNLTAFGLLSFAVGLFVVHAGIGLAFEERRPMLRTLRALGLSLRALIVLLAAELTLLALVGGAIGIALGGLVAAALLPDVAATLRGLYGAEVPGSLTLDPRWWLSGLAMALGGTWVAGGAALWKLARMPLLAPARPRAWAMASGRAAVAMALAGAGLLAMAAILVWRGGGLIAGFAALGGLLIGGVLILPWILGRVMAFGQSRARAPLGLWIWADSRQQLPGLSLALMALLLALSANLGVSTMVSSFRATFTGWLDQRLVSEVYFTARDREEADRITAWAAPRTDAILPIWNVSQTVAGMPAQIYGVADHPTYRQHWPILSGLSDLWDRVAEGEGAMINEQMARRSGIGVGDPLDLPGWRGQVVGVYSDYGNPIGQVLISTGLLTELFPDVERLRYGLRVPPDQAEALIHALTAQGLPPGNIVAQGRLKAQSLAIFDRTFVVTGALNVLTLAVAGFALMTSFLTLAGLRLPQLAPVWALGVTRAQLARIELIRALALGLAVFTLALPFGLTVAWVLLTVVNVAAFGWQLPMQLFPGQWLWLLGLTLIAAALAAALPATRMARRKPSDMLRVFANER